jgi:catechol-2,3-dioxygenase
VTGRVVSTVPKMRGRVRTSWWGVALDAADPVALARFYAAVLGWPVAEEHADGAAIRVPGSNSFISFQRAPGYVAPTWPAAEGRQQMMLHLDVAVDELADAVADAVGLGATVADHQPQDDVRVLLDPEGHPFCLYVDPAADDRGAG